MYGTSFILESVFLASQPRPGTTDRRRARRATLLLAASFLVPGVASAQMGRTIAITFAAPVDETGSAAPAADDTRSYAGRDEAGVPRYVRRAFSAEERRILRVQFGIEDPRRLYLSDTLPTATLIYDTDWDRGERFVVGSHRVGAPSVRRPGESWEELERRLAGTSPLDFAPSTHRADASIESLDSVVRPVMARLLDDARKAGFAVKVTEARRSVERQAYLMTLGGHLTYTATSRHAEGYAVDVTIDDGDIRHVTTREHWIAFRRWVQRRWGGTFRIIGTPEQSWDWPHIEYVGHLPGFGSIGELLGAARWCEANGKADCTDAWRARESD